MAELKVQDTKKQDVNSSAFRSAANLAMTPAWSMTADWWASPLTIRAKQTEYLEKFKNELPEKYGKRLSNSVPINEFRSSIETMAGLVFKTDPKPDETETAIQECSRISIFWVIAFGRGALRALRNSCATATVTS
jgi:hypothetical protein